MDPRSPAPVLFAPGAAHHGVQAPSHPPSTQDGSGEHRRAHLPAIDDPCFVTPLPVRAFVDALLVDEVVLQALRAKRTPALLKMLDDSQKRGRDQGLRDGRVTGLREAIHATLRARGMSLTDDQRARVEACDDPDALTAWLVRAATVGHADDVLG